MTRFPICVENSRIPIWLSAIAPIEIEAITLGFIVFSRAKMNATIRRHETIHYQQFVETLFIGFVLIYLYDYIVNRYRHQMTRRQAYFHLRAEKEAYQNDHNALYLTQRKRYAWLFL